MNSKLAKRVAVAIAGSSQDASVIHLNESNFDQAISESPVDFSRFLGFLVRPLPDDCPSIG
jgi:hypothetical protein